MSPSTPKSKQTFRLFDQVFGAASKILLPKTGHLGNFLRKKTCQKCKKFAQNAGKILPYGGEVRVRTFLGTPSLTTDRLPWRRTFLVRTLCPTTTSWSEDRHCRSWIWVDAHTAQCPMNHCIIKCVFIGLGRGGFCKNVDLALFFTVMATIRFFMLETGVPNTPPSLPPMAANLIQPPAYWTTIVCVSVYTPFSISNIFF